MDPEDERQRRRQRLGAFLRYLRDVSGATQAEIAGALGVTDGAVSVWEKGAADLRPDQLYALAQFHELSFSELLAAAGYDLAAGLTMTEWDARQRERRLSDQSQQSTARPFGRTLRRKRVPAVPTAPPLGGPTYTAALAARAHRPLSRTPVLHAHAV